MFLKHVKIANSFIIKKLLTSYYLMLTSEIVYGEAKSIILPKFLSFKLPKILLIVLSKSNRLYCLMLSLGIVFSKETI